MLVDAMKVAGAKAKLEERPITTISINIYGRVQNTFLNFVKAEGVILNQFKLEPLEEETGQRRKFFSDAEITALQNFRPKTFNQMRA